MFENIGHFFKRIVKEPQKELGSKDAAKERLHLVLMQDRANVSADFLELMKQEIIDVIKKYIVVDEDSIDVRLTNVQNEDGTNGAPALFANIPIVNIKNDMMAEKIKDFEGVDFNKEMGISDYYENAKELNAEINIEEVDSLPDIIELPENYDDTGVNRKDENNLQKESSDVASEIDELDEDDDVTFDDLLKAANEESELDENKNEETDKKKTKEKRKKKK